MRGPTKDEVTGSLKYYITRTFVTCRGQVLLLESGWLSQYSDYATGWTTVVWFPAGVGKGFFVFATVFRPALGPT
jgi:hypothetical protein